MGIFNLTDSSLMPYGKYKGEKLESIPDSYLVFMYNKDALSDPLKEYVEEYLYDKIDKTDEKGVEL